MTAKLRHIAISVPELKSAAEFYKKTFGLEEVNYVETPYGDGLSLSDGVINLTLLKFHTDDAAGDERGDDDCRSAGEDVEVSSRVGHLRRHDAAFGHAMHGQFERQPEALNRDQRPQRNERGEMTARATEGEGQ